MPHNQPELTHAFEWSRALKRKINRDPDFEPWLMLHYLQPVTAARLEQWWATLLDKQCSDPDSFKDALRRVRDQVFFVQYLREVTLRSEEHTSELQSRGH